jgi:phospholipid/cholesterol/gamma-HCH transport system substrate-binding protein
MRARSLVAALVAGAVTLSGCGFHGLYGVNLPGGTDTGDHPYDVYVCFANVLDLVPQSNVKVNDVAVGKVIAISLTKRSDKCGNPALAGWSAKVKLEVRSDVDLPENARATVQQTSLLGEKYVQLAQPFEPASPTRLHNGDTIPLTHTGSAPEVEEVLGALSLVLNGGGLAQIQVIAHQLNAALTGNESAVRDLFTQLQTFTGSLDRQKDQIVNALVSLDKL